MTTNFEYTGERDGVSRYVMQSNGMEVLLREDHAAPVASFLLLYRVGSRNEAVGYTGSTHMLEHMMFKGTPEMNREKGNQIAVVLERVGADFNATTWYDRTNYFETVASDQLELAMSIEADRMRNALIRDDDRRSEMTVVRNELERGENDPMSVMDNYSHATAFREHPYHHPTIGWRSDVEGVPTERLKEFYDTFYWPDNATAIVVGDFRAEEALELLDRHFGKIPRAPRPIPGVYTTEPEQQGERRFVVHRTGSDGIVALNFRTPEAAHPDTAIVLLTGDTSRAAAISAAERGADAFLLKPASPRQVLFAIDVALAGRSRRVRVSNLGEARDFIAHLLRVSAARDAETGQHGGRMGRFSARLAQELGLGEELADRIGFAAVLHDIGKVAIPDAILHKPGPLEPDERTLMQSHARVGWGLLSGSSDPTLQLGALIALHHHERWDGTGYPDGLAGEEIPIEARIATVADVYDALTSDRPYRPAYSPMAALAHVIHERGKAFDPKVVDALVGLLGQASGPDTVLVDLPGPKREVAAA